MKKLLECFAVEFLTFYNFSVIQIDESRLDKRASYAIRTPTNDFRFYPVNVCRY